MARAAADSALQVDLADTLERADEAQTIQPRIDRSLITAINEAHRWFDGLKAGRYQTIAAIANCENRQVSEVSRSISLAVLAPTSSRPSSMEASR